METQVGVLITQHLRLPRFSCGLSGLSAPVSDADESEPEELGLHLAIGWRFGCALRDRDSARHLPIESYYVKAVGTRMHFVTNCLSHMQGSDSIMALIQALATMINSDAAKSQQFFVK